MSQGVNGGKSVLYKVQKPCCIIIIIKLNKLRRIIFCASLKENNTAAAIFSHSPGLNWFVPIIINYDKLTALGWAPLERRGLENSLKHYWPQNRYQTRRIDMNMSCSLTLYSAHWLTYGFRNGLSCWRLWKHKQSSMVLTCHDFQCLLSLLQLFSLLVHHYKCQQKKYFKTSFYFTNQYVLTKVKFHLKSRHYAR